MGKAFSYNCRKVVCCIFLAGLLLAGPAVSLAAGTVCARVKIQIKQELTLERQAFDAHMRINNGLSNISLDNVKVDVSFADEDGNPVVASSDPDNTDAMFFIRPVQDSLENIDNVDGTGTVNPSTSADIHWLIIPSPGSSNGLESGTLYYVGAKLTYTIGGEPKVTEVIPDYILVKPMPEITLDYFLPSDVYGDDPLTENSVEPIEPFSLGVRVKNNGHGVARNLKIESAQPRIKENAQGLLIGFAIEGSEVNGQAAGDSMLVDFGDIAPTGSGVARWTMTCTLSGQFVSLTADYSHSDELGGELTSLIQEVNTHTLVRDVLVDLPGRDAVRDFLATDGGSAYRIHESETTGLEDASGGDPEVHDQSLSANIGEGGDTRTLRTPVTDGFMYVKLPDPFNGQKVLREVVRSDGKIIKPENAWLSHTRFRDNPWQYHFNLFDVNSPGTYTLKFEDVSAVPQPPVLQYIADKDVEEDTQVSFIVEASDPNGTVPALSAAPLPVGATFVDEGDGLGVFDWTPTAGQAGVYQIIYRASDGLLDATRRATIMVKGFTDTDGDNLDDEWELQHFGSLDRDGSGDFDRDGISDLEEFENGEDPAELADLAIQLAVSNPNPSFNDELDLTVTVTNKGPREATGINILDLLSGGLSPIDDDSDDAYDHASGIWDMEDMPALAPGQTAALKIRAIVTRSGKILNIATVKAADQYDPDRSNNSAALILNGGAQSDLALALDSEKLAAATNEIITVALNVSNNGTDDATGVKIEEMLPGNLSFVNSTSSQGDYYPESGLWDVGELVFGSGAELVLTLTIDSNVETVLTAALATGDQPDPDPTNNRSSIVINQDSDDHPSIADLAIHKMASHADVDVDGQAVFTLLVRNNGPDNAGNIEIEDLLPDGLILQSASPSQGTYDGQSEVWLPGIIMAGDLAVMEMRVDVAGIGEQDNTADIVNLDKFDPDGGNNSDTTRVTGLSADIAVIQSVDKTTVNPGGNFEFTIEVTNHGPQDARGVAVSYEAPGGSFYQSHLPAQATFDWLTGQWDVGDLALGETATLVVAYGVETAGEMVTKAGRQSSSPTDTDNTNDEAVLTVVVNAAPVVSAIRNQTVDEGQLFLTIDLDDYVTDANNIDEEIDWTYSGGIELLVAIDDVSHAAAITIPHPDWYGSETITFTAADPFGLSDEREVQFIVTAVNDAPTADIGRLFSGSEGQSITFAGKATDIDSTDLTYFWDFDYRGDFVADKHGIDLQTPTWTYADDDTYTVALRVGDPGGETSEIVTAQVTVADRAPTVSIAGAATVDEGADYSLALSAVDPGDDTVTGWRINWGDGETETISGNPATVLHTYADDAADAYAITASATNEDGTYDAEAAVAVAVTNVSPTVDAGENQTADEGAVVDFSGALTDPGADSWTVKVDYGDSSPVEELDLNDAKIYATSHAYGDNGSYTVTVTVTDDEGGIGTGSLTVFVDNIAPVLSGLASDSPSNGPIELTAALTDAGWLDTHTGVCDFGDGTAAGADIDAEHEKPDATGTLTAIHTYAAEGLFTVSMTMADDDGADCESSAITVLIDKTAPIIEIFEPQAGYYRNTDEIVVDVAVADPESGGVSSGLVPESVEIFLDGRRTAADALLDLSELADGVHTLYVPASDYSGNSAEQEVVFDVGPEPALVHVDPNRWEVKLLDPFDIQHGHHSKDTIKAEISLENVEVETVIPTGRAVGLKTGDGYGDFVVVDIVAAQTGVKPGKEKVASLTLKYVGVDEMDILAFSGDTVVDFYSVNADDVIVINCGQAGYLDRHTVLSTYQSDPPLLSTADIIPDSVLLNDQVPIIKGAARLITENAGALAQPGVIAEPPYGVVKEKKHHVWLANVGQPQQITLEVGSRTIFADEPYPVKWHDCFSLDDDGRLQMMHIRASGKDGLLKVLHHNLQAEARIYLDGDLALTILPETQLVAMEVHFDRFDVMSTLDKEDLERVGGWLVNVHNGAKLKGKHPRKHIRVSDIGHPQKAKLVIGDTVAFDDLPFPIKWSERYLIVDGQRQDLSIKTHGARGKKPQLSINCKKLTRKARLYLDGKLVLLISPPPEVEVSISGELELDGDPATFDGSFRGSAAVELRGRLPKDYDPTKSYQRMDTSGKPPLNRGDRYGNFEVVNFTEGYDDYRVADLELSYYGTRAAELTIYQDSRRKHPIKSFQVLPGDSFVLDVSHLAKNKVYFGVGKKRVAIKLTGPKAAEIGDRFLNCTVMNISWTPIGPPHYLDLTLEYVGTEDAITLTAYGGDWKDVIGTYQVDSAVDPVFTIIGDHLPRGRLGENLVLEYGPVE